MQSPDVAEPYSNGQEIIPPSMYPNRDSTDQMQWLAALSVDGGDAQVVETYYRYHWTPALQRTRVRP
jgi:hypothetical protein